MTSEANRAYVMETVNNMTGNNTETEVDNDDMLRNATTEEEAWENIIGAFNIKMPQFFYWPADIKYQDYSIDEEAQTAIILYKKDDELIHFMIMSNEKSKALLATSDLGKEIKKLNSELMEGINATLWEVFDEGDEKPTYILQWEYKNVYYELSGKLLETEMEDIAVNIMY